MHDRRLAAFGMVSASSPRIGIARMIGKRFPSACHPAYSARRRYRFPTLAEDAFRLRKHSRQYTGRPWVGLKGTVVSRPHCEQVVMVSVLVKPEAEEPARFDLQFLQRLGSFLKFLSWKKCCSPAVNTKSAPQSTHLRTRSWKSAISTVAPLPTCTLVGFGSRRRVSARLRNRFYSISRRFFFRFRLRASACLARSFSPGFK